LAGVAPDRESELILGLNEGNDSEQYKLKYTLLRMIMKELLPDIVCNRRPLAPCSAKTVRKQGAGRTAAAGIWYRRRNPATER
jgi:hypothetical protein